MTAGGHAQVSTSGSLRGREPSDEEPRIRATVKFEEDIKAPFVSLYSFSTQRRRRQEDPFPAPSPSVSRLFPDFRNDSASGRPALKLRDVNRLHGSRAGVTGRHSDDRHQAESRVRVRAHRLVQHQDGRPLLRSRSSSVIGTAIPKGAMTAKPPACVRHLRDPSARVCPEWVDPNCTPRRRFVFG